MSHPSKRLDDAVHQRTRLGILSVLAEVERAEFTYLRDELELTDGNLSRNLAKLGEAGLLLVEKTPGGQARTWARITPEGRLALDDEIAALRELIARATAPRGRAHPIRVPSAEPTT